MAAAPSLGKKRAALSDDAWRHAFATARETVPDDELDLLVDVAVDAIAAEHTAGRRMAVAWSAGKDSIALLHLAQLAGVEDTMYGVTAGLEFPAMTRWVAEHGPDGLETIAAPLDLAWLAEHPDMMFPRGTRNGRWMKLVQHRAQDIYHQRHSLDALLLGRRRSDGNWCGRNGEDRYTTRTGITRWSPIAHWSHEAVLSLILRENLALPPCYGWPHGFYFGSISAWARREFVDSIDASFADCWAIDPDVIREAAGVLPAAAAWIRDRGLEG